MASEALSVLFVDREIPRPSTGRKPVDVAVGLLIQPDGCFLLCTRPPGKAYAGYWEFPGGKLEAGENVVSALTRELAEEIGIQAEDVRPWKTLEVDYPHARVRLHFCKVLRWSGGLRMLEGQEFAWERLPVRVAPVLPGTVPVLAWLGEKDVQ